MIEKFRDNYFFLSNFYEIPVFYNGLVYQNNESAFQAQKCILSTDRIKFINLNPSEAKTLGRKVHLRKDWENVKVDIMADIVKAKFDQNPDLKEKLLNTKDEYLVEGNTWGDKIWGQVNGQGQNLLGNILMNLRSEYQKELDKDYPERD